MHRQPQSRWLFAAAAALPLAVPFVATASSHREAPFIAEHPKVDGTDFYMFRSYEAGRSGYVTLVANYLPLQDAYGGPNYFTLDPDAVYDIHIDNDGDAREDLTFRFRFKNEIQDISLQVGAQNNQKTVAVPLVTTAPGGIGPGVLDRTGLNVIETLHCRARPRRSLRQRQAAHEHGGRRDSRGVHEARRQRRHEVDSRLRGLRGEPRVRRRDPGLCSRAACSSASARIRSR